MAAGVFLACLAKAHAELGQFEDAWRRLDEAMMVVEESKEAWPHPEILRFAGEITLMSPQPDVAKAEAYFQRALAVAREQQAKPEFRHAKRALTQSR